MQEIKINLKKLEEYFEIINIGYQPIICEYLESGIEKEKIIYAESVEVRSYLNDEFLIKFQMPITNGLKLVIDKVGFNNKTLGKIEDYLNSLNVQ